MLVDLYTTLINADLPNTSLNEVIHIIEEKVDTWLAYNIASDCIRDCFLIVHNSVDNILTKLVFCILHHVH